MRDEEIAAALAAGRARYPDVTVPDATLLPRLIPRLATATPAHVADVFVAVAATAGDRAAATHVHERLAALATVAARGIVTELDEVVQTAAISLLVDDPPKLDSYAGLGSLDAWLRVVILRTALSARHRLGTAEQPWLEIPLFVEMPAWRAHVGAFRSAFEAALAALPANQRVVLRQHYIDGVSVDALGRIYNVTRMSVYRWLAQAKAAVVAQVRAELGSSLALSADEVDSMMRAVRSSFSITVERVLATSVTNTR
jgi:RNA polymerase sigma-70 factor, ECF subfamily